MRPLIGADTEVAPTPARALERAREEAGPEGNVLVAGSLYLVGAVRAAIKGDSTVHPNEH
jgi:folylpolyglutamate synthase/dihydropteroate synthase